MDDLSPAHASTSALFEPLRLGDIAIANRMVMAPLTRARSTADERSTHSINVQRASAGLIVSEATQIRREGQGSTWTHARTYQLSPAFTARHSCGVLVRPSTPLR